MRRVSILTAVLIALPFLTLHAQDGHNSGQQDRDSLVRLLQADLARLVEIDGKEYRKVVGDAVFLHNDTYLYCDSAYWNVADEYIDAIGSIRIVQENTVLTGDSIKYVIPENTAKFRGHLVELIDRDSNVLRTNFLDYNTKDSTALFYRGGAMRDSDGNLIESLTGTYSSPLERFDFIGSVEMFSDSLFFVCDTLNYDTRNETARFRGNTQGWYGDNTISSGAGRYERTVEKLYFRKKVHILTEDYEMWCDSLYYDRLTEYSLLLGNVQLLDTVDNAIALAGELRYWNEPRRAELYRQPALVVIDENEEGVRDSVFMSSDTLIYYTMRMCDVDSAVVEAAEERYRSALVDPMEQSKKSAGTAGAGRSASSSSGAASKTQAQSSAASLRQPGPGTLPSPFIPAEDTLMTAPPAVVQDSLTVAGLDSLSLPDSVSVVDSLMLPPPPDTTEVSFVEAYHHVRIYKSDIQVLCDSLLFTSIDSIARLFTEPVLWYEIKSQITADSMQFLFRNQTLDRGYLFANAFVISEEVPGKYYHQIKSPEMIGYFVNSQVSRFDALGGVTAMFYVAEDSVITTMNQKECRLMTGRLKDGQVQRILYTENIKSDAYPVWDLAQEKSRLRDFNWMPDLRPASRYDVTARGIRTSRRSESVPSPNFPSFKYAEKYFKGYMKGIMREIDSRKPLIWVER